MNRRPLIGQQATEGADGGGKTALFPDGHPAPGQSPRRLAQALAIPDRGDQLGVVVPGAEAQQLANRGATGDVVDGQPHVALELAEGDRGQIAEDAVHPAGVESESAQPLLELGHVVAPQHGGAPVEEAVAEAAPRLDQRRPGLRAADTVDPQAPAVLEGLDGGSGAGAEASLRVDALGEGQPLEAVLDVGHRGAVVAQVEPDFVLAHPGCAAGDGSRREGTAPPLTGGPRAPAAVDPCPWPRRCGPPAPRP